MNKQSHRIIFNKARGILMAVAESANSHSCGDGSSKRRVSPLAGLVRFTLTPGAVAVLLLITGTVGLSPYAKAQIVADRAAPVRQQPTILNAGNGVPLVNIQTPSAAGVSRNTYSQFDVPSSGVILNNSRTDTQTVQGGWVQGNPWLAGGSARVILNEVNSSSPSAINGYVEVGGQRAEVVIANASGINVSGGGFINASRVTLTTGSAQFNGAGGIDSYSVSQGQINIDGQGLNTSGSDYTDLISRSLQLNAGIWAKNLKVTTGANQVDAANTTATPIAGSGAAPAFAIDSTALGGMYANQITLIGTDQGVGVRNMGQIGASVGNVQVTVDGQITNQGIISSVGHTQIDAQGGIDNSGTIYAQGNARLSTQGAITNSATIAAQGDTTLQANGPSGQISSTAGSLIAAGLTPDNALSNSGKLNLTATAGTTVNGQLAAGYSLGLSGSTLNLTGATIGGKSVNLVATTGNLDASQARITALNTLTAGTLQTLRTDGANIYANQLNLQARDLSNSGGALTQSGSGAMSLVIPGSIDNTGGVIASNAQTLTLTTSTLINTNGWIQHAGTGSLGITASQSIDNTGGTLISSTDATLNAGQLINANGFVGAGQDLRLTTGSLSGAGTVMAERDGTINLQGDYVAGNLIAANRNLTINSTGSFTNQATIQAGNNLSIQAADISNDNADQSSSLLAGGTLVTTSNTFSNTGTVIAGSLSINATQSIINRGPKALIGAADSGGILELLAPVIENRDDTTATDTPPQTTIIGQGAVVLAGGKDANGTYTAGSQVLNQSALIQSAGDLVVQADTLTNTRRVLTAGTTFVDTGSSSGSVYWTDANPDVPGGRYIEPPHGGKWNSLYTGTDYTTTTARNSVEQISPEAQILVGGSFMPAVNTLQNYWSKVSAQGDIILNGVSLDQDSWRGTQSLQERTTSSGVYHYRTYKGIFWIMGWGPEITYVAVPAYASSFTANGSIGGSGNSINNPVSSNPANLPGIHAALPQNPTDILSLPTSSLYHVNTSPSSHYLVESNPAFANRAQWLGSDAYLSLLGYDPNTVQKRLGDNYYEQQLVRQQVLALSGNAVAAGYADSQAQFEQLYAEGARLAKELKLPIGAHLSAEQAAALTSNVVILETREVTTPSGRQQVLVPIVYLAHVQPGDLQANGPLIAAKDIGLFDSKGFSNEGAVIARNSLTVKMAQDATLNNTGGTLQAGGLLQLGTTNTDIDLTSARVKAGDLTIVSGKDLILNTASQERTTRSAISTRTQTDLGRTASIEVSHDANLTTTGAFTQNAGQIKVGGNLNADIGGSYNLGTVAQTDHQTADYKRSRGTSVKTDITRTTQQTSSIEVGGDATIIAGQDINTKGAEITSDGNLALKAGRDVNLGTAENSLKSDMAFQHSQSGLLSSSKTKLHEQSNQTSNVGTTLSGNVSTVVAGHDINVTGSNVVSTAGTSLAAQNDIKIGAASDTYQNNRTEQTTKSGVMGSGGFGFTIGTRQQTDDQKGTTTVAVGSTIGSTDGNVVLQAGQKYSQQGSDVLAPKGNIAITGKQVDITEARETTRNETERKLAQSGLTIALTSPVITALQTAQQMNKASRQTSDARMKVLAAANTGMAAASAASAVQDSASASGGINLAISIGGSQSKSKVVENSDSGHGSTVQAAGDVVIIATGADKDSNLTIQSSDIKAGNNVLLAADNDINLLAGKNTADQKSTNSSVSGSIGVSIGTSGIGVTLSASGARGKADGNDVTYDNTHVEAGKKLVLESGGNTTVKGAVAKAEQIQATVGGDLKIESLQDTSHFESKQQSIGGSITVGVGVSGSISASSSKVNSNYANVTEQSGFKAGDGGFQVDVKGNTDLKGAAITSTDKAVQEEKNTFQTGGALTTSDIRNTANYSGNSVGFTVGTSVSNDGSFKPVGNSAGIGSDKGSAGSTTQAGISGIAGNKNARTGDAETGINKIFDANKVQADINAQVLITQTFGAQASKLIGDYAATKMTEARALQEQAAKESDPDRVAQLRAQAQNIVDQWGDQGSMRLLAHTVVGGLTGGVSGAAGAATSTLTAPEIAKALNDAGVNPELTKALTAFASTTLGGVIGGTAGAGAAFNEVTNNFLGHQARNQLTALRAKKVLSQDEKRQLVMLEIADQSSDALLAKFRSGAPLNGTERYNLNVYLGLYQQDMQAYYSQQLPAGLATQMANKATQDLLNNGAPTANNYSYPYAADSATQIAYMNKLRSSQGIFATAPDSANRDLFNQAKRETGMGGDLFGGVIPNDAYLPSVMQNSGSNATLDSLRNSPVLATAGYLIATGAGASEQTKQSVATSLSQLSDVGASFVLPRTSVSPAVGTTVAAPGPGAANASVDYPSNGSIKVTPGAKPDANEVAAGIGLAQQFGYEVKFQQTANDRGVKGVQTADMVVTGLGQVDVYTPLPSTSPDKITKVIESKASQAAGILVQANLLPEDMASIAARTWGKPNAQSIQSVIFQKPDGTITIFKRPGG